MPIFNSRGKAVRIRLIIPPHMLYIQPGHELLSAVCFCSRNKTIEMPIIFSSRVMAGKPTIALPLPTYLASHTKYSANDNLLALELMLDRAVDRIMNGGILHFWGIGLPIHTKLPPLILVTHCLSNSLASYYKQIPWSIDVNFDNRSEFHR